VFNLVVHGFGMFGTKNKLSGGLSLVFAIYNNLTP
jgi:hypothetical protein